MKIKKTYKFALYSSLMITMMLSVLLVAFFYKELTIINTVGFIIVCFVVCLLVIQYRSEKFIYSLIKKTYEEVSLLDETNFHQEAVTTDVKTLTSDVRKFARENKLKIETLQIRDEYRREFMGNIAHELKTPLFTIQSYILTLLDGAAADENVREKYLNRASKGVDRLIYIVDDLDLITKIEVGNLSLKISEFDIIELIKEIFELFEIKAQSNGVGLIFDKLYSKPVFVKGDKEKIRQVATNLIINSIKYGQNNGTTEVSIEQLNEDKIVVRITDNGIGIEPIHLPRLFERFYRVDNTGSRDKGGSGLGLSIVKHIIEAHNQKIYIESEYGVGSEFSFTLEAVK
ncbi:MAG: sensor histidine kinase [Flavobacteriaceae bacterium]|nr:sensor histidine kinase [Flavobacteriaceae bacterium]